MKVKLYQFGLIVAAFVLLFAALPAHAANKYGSIYAVSPFGEIVRDPFGNCIRTPQWTPERDVRNAARSSRSNHLPRSSRP
jgi:OmpA-OmpF porin, OOP family